MYIGLKSVQNSLIAHRNDNNINLTKRKSKPIISLKTEQNSLYIN